MPKIREILADERIRGHFGYVSMEKTEKVDHVRLRGHASNLLDWVKRWLR
jgi:hypothetical protein